MTKDRQIASPMLLATTVLVMLLAIVGLTTNAGAPPAAASGRDVAAWFRDHQSAVQWSTWVATVTIPAFALMTALLRPLLPRPHRDVFLIGATLLICMNGIQTWFLAGLALHAGTL